jgi:tripartite-type tricarboxylate transporter receptor subunit TctC
VAMELAAKAPADGYTILGDVGSITINAALYTDLKVKPLTDFIPVSIVTHTPSLLALLRHKFPSFVSFNAGAAAWTSR